MVSMKLNIEKINKEINRLGLNKKTLAEKMGIKSQWIYFILADHRSHTFKTVQKFADFFGIDPKDLLI